MTNDHTESDVFKEWLRADEERYARREKRRWKLARWFAIPSGLAALAFGGAVGNVLKAGLTGTAMTLIVSWVALLACQWIHQILLSRGDYS